MAIRMTPPWPSTWSSVRWTSTADRRVKPPSTAENASRHNLAAIKKLEVEDVVFSKGRGLQVSEMAKSTWVYRSLRRFRAGIEAGISFLKRCFGLDRCTWRGLKSFKAYTWASIVSANLLLLARHQLR